MVRNMAGYQICVGKGGLSLAVCQRLPRTAVALDIESVVQSPGAVLAKLHYLLPILDQESNEAALRQA